eukprot:Opistho-2@16118
MALLFLRSGTSSMASCINRSGAAIISNNARRVSVPPHLKAVALRRFASGPDANKHIPFYRRLFNAYNAALEKRPIPTKAVTSGVLFALGDVIAQKLSTEDSEFDFKRLARASAYGFAILGPLSHYHFNLLHWIVVTRLGIRGAAMPFAKVALEQFGYWSPFILSVYITSMGLMEGLSVTEATRRLRERFWPTMKANWVVWPAVGIINFRFVPVAHQLNFVLIVSLGWAAYLSAMNAAAIAKLSGE